MKKFFVLLLLLTSCATGTVNKAALEEERASDAVKEMQREFNQLTSEQF